MNIKKSSSIEPVFEISRTFRAPRALVWKVFTDPEHLQHWWGPKGFTVLVSRMEFRLGGTYHYCLRSPDGKKMWGKFLYREINPYDRIVLFDSFSDESGGVTRHPFSPTWPLQMLSTFTFTEKDGNTTLTVQWTPLASTTDERKTFEEGMSSMNQGWSGTLDQLDEYLAKVQGEQAVASDVVVRIGRRFDATSEQVFDAWLSPRSASQWLFATPTGKMLRVEIDARVGGDYTIIEQRGTQTAEHIGKYIEIDRPRRLVFTFGGPGFPDTRVTAEIVPQEKGCELTLTHNNVWRGYEESVHKGWADILEGLDIYLTKASSYERSLAPISGLSRESDCK